MTEWQPMETAPKDGTLVDLMSGDEVTRRVYWGDIDDPDEDDPFGYGWLRDGEYALEEGSKPSVWRLAQ